MCNSNTLDRQMFLFNYVPPISAFHNQPWISIRLKAAPRTTRRTPVSFWPQKNHARKPPYFSPHRLTGYRIMMIRIALNCLIPQILMLPARKSEVEAIRQRVLARSDVELGKTACADCKTLLEKLDRSKVQSESADQLLLLSTLAMIVLFILSWYLYDMYVLICLFNRVSYPASSN